jgi:hypothetical protein
VLFAATPFLGGGSNFTVGTVGYLAILNIIWLVGLVVACELPRLFDRGRAPRSKTASLMKGGVGHANTTFTRLSRAGRSPTLIRWLSTEVEMARRVGSS